MKVLVVDDDNAIRGAMSLLLEEEGHQVAQASDGGAALEYLKKGDRPSVILLDMSMPGMDGRQFRAAQLKDDALADIPVVLCTADRKVEEKAKALGALTWLRKPLDVKKFLGVVKRLAGQLSPAAQVAYF